MTIQGSIVPDLAVQSQLFPDDARGEVRNTTVFSDNMKLPIHRWFRYSAGFSAEWVQGLIAKQGPSEEMRVLDPFVGSGTTLIAAQSVGATSIGLETHPLVARIAAAKLQWTADPRLFVEKADSVLEESKRSRGRTNVVPELLQRIFETQTLDRLTRLRDVIARRNEGSSIDQLLWLALVAVLRACSPAGTAQWQYVLPNKVKSKTADPSEAFRAQVRMMAHDMAEVQSERPVPEAKVLQDDARECSSIPDGWATTVITSPPYPNNYDYADATRIEMTFLGEIQSWGDLQSTVRQHLMHSCSQHMTGYRPEEVLESELLDPIRGELQPVYQMLSEVRLTKGGRKAYHSMVVAYFHDLAQTWHALRRVTAPGATVCFVVGDSAPYAVHVPAERWIGELAVAAGFRGFTFEKVRDRNVKWKNRKHRVPLQEGRLWVEA